MRPQQLVAIVSILVIVIVSLSCAKIKRDEVKTMDVKQVEARILAKDWDVQEEISKMGPSVVPALLKLAKHKDPDVRELAVSCLGEFRGPEVASALADVLYDPVGNVRVKAFNMLEQAYDPSILPKLQKVLITHKDEYVRESVALTIGRIGDRSAIDSLRTNLTTEKVSEVKSAILQALARLGDDEARKIILAELRSGQVKTQWQAMEKLEYVNDRSLAVYLKPFLDDARPAFDTAADPLPVTVRVKDVALKTIAVLFNQPFSFRLDGYRPCTDAELRECREFMKTR